MPAETVCVQTELTNMWRRAVHAMHHAAAAKAECQIAEAEFERALARALLDRCVPPGHSIDFLGDGTIKPVAECRKFPV